MLRFLLCNLTRLYWSSCCRFNSATCIEYLHALERLGKLKAAIPPPGAGTYFGCCIKSKKYFTSVLFIGREEKSCSLNFPSKNTVSPWLPVAVAIVDAAQNGRTGFGRRLSCIL